MGWRGPGGACVPRPGALPAPGMSFASTWAKHGSAASLTPPAVATATGPHTASELANHRLTVHHS